MATWLTHSFPLPPSVLLQAQAQLTSRAVGLPLAPAGAHCGNPSSAGKHSHLKTHCTPARLPARARAMPGLPPPHGLTARNAFREQCWFPSPHPGKEGGPQDACHNSGALPITAGPAGCRGKALQAPHHTGCLGEGRPTLPAKGPQHPVLPAHSHAHTHRALHCSGPRQPQPWDPAPPSQG